jgi:hypothetical protein
MRASQKKLRQPRNCLNSNDERIDVVRKSGGTARLLLGPLAPDRLDGLAWSCRIELSLGPIPGIVVTGWLPLAVVTLVAR